MNHAPRPDGIPPDTASQIAKQLTRTVETALGCIAVSLLTVVLIAVLANIVARYIFHTGMIGSEDFSIWINVALISIGAPISLSGPLSIRLNFFSGRLYRPFKILTDIIADAFSVLTALILMFGSYGVMRVLGGTSPTLGLPEWIRFAFLGVSGALILILLILRHIENGRGAALLSTLLLGGCVYFSIPYLSIETYLPPSLALAITAAIALICSAPLAHGFLAAAYIAIAFGGALNESTIVSTTVSGMSRFLLLAVPFFLLTGSLLSASGAARRLVDFASSVIGHKRGGLAQTVLLTGTLFSGASGSSVANAVFSASTFQPELVRYGYPPARAGAIIAASSVLDNLIPPSIAFLILATATNLSVGGLLFGGLFAGLVMALCLAVAIHLTTRGQTGSLPSSASQRAHAAAAALPAFGLGVIVVVGIRIGIVTTTEAAALAAAYTFVLVVFTKTKRIPLYQACRQSAMEAAAIGFLIGSAGPFSFQIAVDGISTIMTTLLYSLGNNPEAVLAVSVVILLIIGLVLDIGAAILLLGPILLPVAVASGLEPIQFGVILVSTLMIGGLTPPVGILVLVVSGVTNVPATALFKAVVPYLSALLSAILILCLYALYS